MDKLTYENLIQKCAPLPFTKRELEIALLVLWYFNRYKKQIKTTKEIINSLNRNELLHKDYKLHATAFRVIILKLRNNWNKFNYEMSKGYFIIGNNQGYQLTDDVELIDKYYKKTLTRHRHTLPQLLILDKMKVERSNNEK